MCASADLHVVGTATGPDTGDDYRLYECAECGSRSFDLAEHPTDLAAFYESLATDRSETYEGPFRPDPYWRREVQLIRAMLGREPRSVLDVGCRTGDFLLHWPESVRRVGVELSHRSVVLARRRGLVVHECPVEELDSGERYDVVTCYAVLEHLAEPQGFLNKLTSLLEPGGLLGVLVPSFETAKARLLERIGRQWHMYRPPEHLNLYSRRFLDRFLAQRGFALLERRYTSGGTVNPLRRIPVAGRAFARGMWWLDAYGPLRRVPLFDHMYSYYRREARGMASGSGGTDG